LLRKDTYYITSGRQTPEGWKTFTMILRARWERRSAGDKSQHTDTISGVRIANMLGLTTQVPMTFEIVSNKATKDVRKTSLADVRLIIRRPRTEVTENNYKVLQFLDLMKDVDEVSELEGEELQKRIKLYMAESSLTFDMMKPYLRYYPDRLYKNLYDARVLNG